MKTKSEKYMKTRYLLAAAGTSQANKTKSEHPKQAKHFRSDISKVNWKKRNPHKYYRCIQLLTSSPGLKQG